MSSHATPPTARTLAIGDVHGCFVALQTLAAGMPFREDDLLITLGDYVDRGPQSREVIDWMLARLETGRLVPLRGNHEEMMFWALGDQGAQKSWMAPYVGGRETLDSYAPEDRDGRLVDVPDSHWRFISQQTQMYFETEDWIFAHAHLHPRLSLLEHTSEYLLWDRFDAQPLHVSGKRLICGHTEQISGVPRVYPHGICIDTRAYGGGWLTALDVATGQYGQANQKGDFRRGKLALLTVKK
jgi:serine/threonine protein phosphatase 1